MFAQPASTKKPATMSDSSNSSPTATTNGKPAFHQLIAELTAEIAGKSLDGALDQWLNATHGAGSARFEQLRQACIGGVAEGWLCEREGARITRIRTAKST